MDVLYYQGPFLAVFYFLYLAFPLLLILSEFTIIPRFSLQHFLAKNWRGFSNLHDGARESTFSCAETSKSVLLGQKLVNMSLSLSATASATLGPIPTGTISALIGQPPNTTDDYYIAKYLLMSFDLDTDPALGVVIAPVRPVDYVYESRETRIMVSMSIATVTMVVITGLRLGVRAFRTKLMLGWDDVVIIPGVLLAISWPAMQICAALYGGVSHLSCVIEVMTSTDRHVTGWKTYV